jgi:hypothetical protein
MKERKRRKKKKKKYSVSWPANPWTLVGLKIAERKQILLMKHTVIN